MNPRPPRRTRPGHSGAPPPPLRKTPPDTLRPGRRRGGWRGGQGAGGRRPGGTPPASRETHPGATKPRENSAESAQHERAERSARMGRARTSDARIGDLPAVCAQRRVAVAVFGHAVRRPHKGKTGFSAPKVGPLEVTILVGIAVGRVWIEVSMTSRAAWQCGGLSTVMCVPKVLGLCRRDH